MVSISDRLKELMNVYNISQADICKATGIPKSSLSMYLEGTRFPKQDKIVKISEKYNVNPTWLNGFDVPMTGQNLFTKENAMLDAKISNDPVLKEAIKKYYELNEYDRKLILDFIDYKYDKREC